MSLVQKTAQSVPLPTALQAMFFCDASTHHFGAARQLLLPRCTVLAFFDLRFFTTLGNASVQRHAFTCLLVFEVDVVVSA